MSNLGLILGQCFYNFQNITFSLIVKWRPGVNCFKAIDGFVAIWPTTILSFTNMDLPFLPLSIVNKHWWNRFIIRLCAFIVMCLWSFMTSKVSCWMHCVQIIHFTCVGSNVNNFWTLPLALGNNCILDSVSRHVKSSTFFELFLHIVVWFNGFL